MAPPKIYGLIGYPVKHSLSPSMHNVAFKALNINAEYRLFEVKPEELQDFLLKNISVADIESKSFLSHDVLGFNITIPHKVRALELASLVENITVRQYPDVVLSGAINTVKRDGEKLHYRNTDTMGFMKSLREDLRFNAENKKIIIFGCGGAGRAVVAGLTQEGSKVKKIYLYDVNEEVAKSAEKHFSRFDFVKDKLEFITAAQIPDKIKDSDLLVNASPIGMKELDGSVIDKDLLRLNEKLFIYDVVYNRETQLIKDAKSLRLAAIGGLGMLLYQGASAFEFWTGQKAPVEVMRKGLIEAVGR